MGDGHLDLDEMAGVALEIGAAHQRSIGSATSSTGDSAREIASQSSICIVPSGRSAITWTVQPDSPEILIRTSR
jgi:hypothetical protein